MLWTLWSALCGLPVGALALLALDDEAATAALRAAAGAGAVAFAAGHGLLVRRRSDDPSRPIRLAVGASMGWAAAPAWALASRGLGPGAGWMLLVCAIGTAVSVWRAARDPGPALSAAPLRAGVLSLAAGSVLWVAVAAVVAALGGPAELRGGATAAAIYDFDASVPTRTLPDCAQRLASHRVVIDSGARPRWGPNGEFVWFDAMAEAGRRQVHRLDLASGEVVCWTCGQPGNNVRPDPGPRGHVLVFDSDRHSDTRNPANTEVYRVSSRGDEPPSAARRLTHHVGPDEHAQMGASPAVVAWSRRQGGRYAIASATISQGHGGVSLRSPGLLLSGGADWIAPLAWSPDARSIVAVRGNPFRPLGATRFDPATGESTLLLDAVPGTAGVGFNADGGWIAIATTQRAHWSGLLPSWLGFAIAPQAIAATRDRALFRGTGLATGPSSGPLAAVELGELADWGEPTGVTLSPDARAAILGQRRPGSAGGGERLVRLDLECRADGA